MMLSQRPAGTLSITIDGREVGFIKGEATFVEDSGEVVAYVDALSAPDLRWVVENDYGLRKMTWVKILRRWWRRNLCAVIGHDPTVYGTIARDYEMREKDSAYVIDLDVDARCSRCGMSMDPKTAMVKTKNLVVIEMQQQPI